MNYEDVGLEKGDALKKLLKKLLLVWGNCIRPPPFMGI